MSQPIYMAHWLRDVLIEHMLAGGRLPYNHPPNTKARRDRFRMITSGHLELVRTLDGKFTEVTYKGRAVLAYILADHADALVRMGKAVVAEDKRLVTFILQEDPPMRGIGQVRGWTKPSGRRPLVNEPGEVPEAKHLDEVVQF